MSASKIYRLAFTAFTASRLDVLTHGGVGLKFRRAIIVYLRPDFRQGGEGRGNAETRIETILRSVSFSSRLRLF